MTTHGKRSPASRAPKRGPLPRILAARLLDLGSRHRVSLERLARRGTVTILFTDIANFTRFTESLGEKAAVHLLDRHDQIVAGEVRRRGGRVIKSLGDGSMAAFPDAAGAAAAAAGILGATRGLHVKGHPIRLRIGMDTGRASRRGDDYVGHAVNVASRLTRRARPGQALASDAVRKASGTADGAVEWRDLGTLRLKGIARPPRTWRVRPAAPRKATTRRAGPGSARSARARR